MEIIVFKEKDNPQLAEETYRLRYRIFTKKLHWFHENKECMERDEYDGLDRTRYIVIKDGDDIVGHLRIVVGSPSLTEQLAQEKFKSENHICASRLYISPKAKRPKKIAVYLMSETFKIGEANWVDYYIACTYQDYIENQSPISAIFFPEWKRMEVDGFPSIFLYASRKTISYFLKLLYTLPI